MAEKNTKPVQGPGGRGPKGPRPKVENPGKISWFVDVQCYKTITNWYSIGSKLSAKGRQRLR